MPSAQVDERDFEHDLAKLGVLQEEGGALVSDTLDGALEWMEERILGEAGQNRKHGEEALLEAKDMTLFQGLPQAAFEALSGCLREVSLSEGATLFSSGEPGEELFFVRRGRVQILLPLEGGRHHHVATFGPGEFFGEINFLDRGTRSADAVAKVATELYALSRARFDEQMGASTQSFASEVFVRLALAIAERLRQADAELRALQER